MADKENLYTSMPMQSALGLYLPRHETEDTVQKSSLTEEDIAYINGIKKAKLLSQANSKKPERRRLFGKGRNKDET